MAKKIKKYQGVSILEVLEGADNYNSWIADQFLAHTKSPVMEFGAGTGNITQFVSRKHLLTATEIDDELLDKLKKQYLNKKGISVIHYDITKNPPKELQNKFNTIYSSNVLEHVEDDREALTNLRKTLIKNGRLILLVPAKKRFYGRLDKSLGHFRRYEKDELISVIEKSGFEIEKLYYFNILGLLAWKIRDVITKENELKSTQIKLFDSIVPVLKLIESMVKPPMGISLIVVARKVK